MSGRTKIVLVSNVVVNLVVLSYLKLFADDSLKVRLVHWLTIINSYALGSVLYDVIAEKIRDRRGSNSFDEGR